MAPQPELVLINSEPVCAQFTIEVNFDQTMSSAGITAILGSFNVSNGNLVSGTWTSASADDSVWRVDILPVTDNDTPVTVQLAAGAYQDGVGDDNEASNLLTVTHDGTAPQPVISTAAPEPVCGQFTVEVDFDRTVSSGDIGWIQGFFSIANGSLQSTTWTSVSADNSVWQVDMVPWAGNDNPVTIQLYAGAYQDACGRNNLASNMLTVANDGTPPQPVISTSVAEPVCAQFTIEVNFDHSVISGEISGIEGAFDVGNGVLVSGTWTSVSPDYTVWQVDVLPDSGNTDPITVQLPAGVYQDDCLRDNLASNTLVVTHDNAPQPVVSTGATEPVCGQFTIEVSFGRTLSSGDISALEGAITVTNGALVSGTWTSVSADDSVWQVDVLPDPDNNDPVSVQVPADLYQDICFNLASNTLAVTYDGTPPQPVISTGATEPVCGQFTIEIDFDTALSSGNIAGIEGAITVANGVLASGTWTSVSPDYTVWQVDVLPAAGNDDPVVVQIPAGLYQDACGRDNLASGLLTLAYDGTPPQPEISTGATEPLCGQFTIEIDFDRAMSAADISAVEGTIIATNGALVPGTWTSVSPDYTVWQVDILPTTGNDNPVSVQIPAGVYQDACGRDNLASNLLTLDHDGTPVQPVVTGPAGPVDAPFTVTIDFGQILSDSEAEGAITVTNGTESPAQNPSGTCWDFVITPSADPVTVEVDAGEYTDECGRPNLAAVPYTVPYTPPLTILSIYGGTDLPPARERMRYLTQLHVIGIEGGATPVWSLDSHTLDLELVTETGLATNEIILRTQVDGSDVTYIPDGWPPSQAIQVSVTAGAQSGAATLTLPVENTFDNIDVAILLDRSGSMGGTRWTAATEGAQLFSQLIADIGLPSDHNVGLYWFHGDCYNKAADHTDPGMSAFTGVFPLGASDSSIGSGQVLANVDDIDDTCAANGPTGCTAIGAGLVNCKDELVALGNADHERVILALSDGMENCHPFLLEVFPDGGPSGYWPGTDGVRVYAVAVLTLQSWADQLRDMADKTGGIGALDIKHIASNSTIWATLIRRWFVSSFQALFGLVALDETPDPTLAGGAFRYHPVILHLGVEKAYFYIMMEDADDGEWRFGVIPPGEKRAIYVGDKSYPGVSFLSGRRHHVISVDLPLGIGGHGHRWAGEWRMVVVRKPGAPARDYVVGAFVKQDVKVLADIIAPASPKPGDKANIVVSVRDRNDKPVSNAVVSAVVRSPGQWIGHQVAVEMESNPERIKKLRRSKSKAAKDTLETADGVLRELYEAGEVSDGTQRKVLLKEDDRKKGVYAAEVSLTRPGDWGFDISATGIRVGTQKELSKKLGPALKELGKYYSAAEVKQERAFIARHAGREQPFHVELRRQLAVGFLPSVAKTEVQGYFDSGRYIILHVQPRDRQGTLLGPGWKDRIAFHIPGVSRPVPAEDLGNSVYQATIQLEAKSPGLNTARHAVTGTRLRVSAPAPLGAEPVADNELPLKGFGVTVLGVTIPITVRSLVGNRKSKETHLATCRYAARITPKHKVYFHDLKEVLAHGYDTCEHCLPLICNMNPGSLEVHKPSCPWVKKISAKNRLEVGSLKEAQKLGMDGCATCLKAYHKR